MNFLRSPLDQEAVGHDFECRRQLAELFAIQLDQDISFPFIRVGLDSFPADQVNLGMGEVGSSVDSPDIPEEFEGLHALDQDDIEQAIVQFRLRRYLHAFTEDLAVGDGTYQIILHRKILPIDSEPYSFVLVSDEGRDQAPEI